MLIEFLCYLPPKCMPSLYHSLTFYKIHVSESLFAPSLSLGHCGVTSPTPGVLSDVVDTDGGPVDRANPGWPRGTLHGSDMFWETQAEHSEVASYLTCFPSTFASVLPCPHPTYCLHIFFPLLCRRPLISLGSPLHHQVHPKPLHETLSSDSRSHSTQPLQINCGFFRTEIPQLVPGQSLENPMFTTAIMPCMVPGSGNYDECNIFQTSPGRQTLSVPQT